MAEHRVQRIVIACDAASDITAAVGAAAALAARSNAALHGVFLEDENLYRLAALPFGRQVTLSSAVAETLDIPELDRLSAVLSTAMRRSLAEAAAERGLEWSFGSLRSLPSVAALARIEGDLLVVQGSTRPFSGSWSAPSSWCGLPEGHGRLVLIHRLPRTEPGTVVILLSTSAGCERVLLPGLAVAEPGDDVVILLCGGSSSDIVAVEEVAASAGARKEAIRVEIVPADSPALFRQINRLKPVLIVVDAARPVVGTARDVLTRTRCDVLLVP